MAVYKDFDLNAPGDPPPWGDKEVSAFKDIIDTIVADSVGTQGPGSTGGKDVTGHKHWKLYNGYAEEVINTQSDVSIQINDYSGYSFRMNVRDSGGADIGTIFQVDMSDWDYDYVKLGTIDSYYPLTLTNNSEVYTRPWQEITSRCTFEGFSDYESDNYVWARQIGSLVYVQLHILGTSDNPFTRVIFPFSMQGMCKSGSFFGYDSSGRFNVVGSHELDSNTLTTENYYGNENFWQSSGLKFLSGSFVTSVTDPQF